MSLHIRQEYFALLARWLTRRNINDCLMALMRHLNAGLAVGEKLKRRGPGESESQMSKDGGIFQNADVIW